MESSSDLEIVCVVCSKIFVYTAGERAFMEGLLKTGQIKEIVVPKRCKDCRTPLAKKKELKNKGFVAKSPAPLPLPPEPKEDPLGDGSYTPGHEGRIPDHEVVELSSDPVKRVSLKPAIAMGLDFMKFPQNPSLPKPQIETKPEIPPFNLPISDDINKPDKEIRCVLVAGEFERLVCRQEIVFRHGNQRVVLILADIGPQAMKDAMKKAVLTWWGS